MHALKDKEGNVNNNFNEIVMAGEDGYSELYRSQIDHRTLREIDSVDDTEIPCITADEVKIAGKGISCGEAAGEGGITADLIEDGGDIILEKLASLFTKCIKSCNVPRSWKNANIILIHTKGDIKELKNYGLISLLPVIYKLFAKVISTRIRETLDFNQRRAKLVFVKVTQ